MMELSDKHIKDILKETRSEYTNDLQLEDDILEAIGSLKGHESLLVQSKRRARIGLRISATLVTLFILSIFFSLIKSEAQTFSEGESILPSLMVLILLVISFVLIHGSQVLFTQNER